MFEFTDGTGDTDSCPAVGLASILGDFTGFRPWLHPEWLEEMVIWANEQYMSIAVETGTDMIMILEHFCGHGYHANDPESRCYRGPDTERWFDGTCIHPNPAGHAMIADMFMAVIEE